MTDELLFVSPPMYWLAIRSTQPVLIPLILPPSPNSSLAFRIAFSTLPINPATPSAHVCTQPATVLKAEDTVSITPAIALNAIDAIVNNPIIAPTITTPIISAIALSTGFSSSITGCNCSHASCRDAIAADMFAMTG